MPDAGVRRDAWIVGLLTAGALVTRCWGLFDPREVVWDEVHFLGFAGRYYTGAYYLDVHPPLGKLLLAAAARTLGITGDALASGAPAPALRLVPAVAGSLVIPVFFSLLRALGVRRRLAVLGAALLLLDNALLVQSRFILVDSLLILFGVAAVACFAAARRRTGPPRAWLLVTAAACAGLAAATKWTGLSALGLIALFWVADAVNQRPSWRRLAAEGALLVAVPALLYLASFAIHFALLPRTGPGAMHMSPAFQATLEGHPRYVEGARVPFLRATMELNRRMLDVNVGWARTSHPGASPWYTWPISKHTFAFWNARTADGRVRWIILIGNPVVWWGILIGIAAVGVAAIRSRERLMPAAPALRFLGAAILLNWLPFAAVARPMFIYHYFFGMIYSLAFAVVGTGAAVGWSSDAADGSVSAASRRAASLFWGIPALALLSFLWFAPISYGRPLTERAAKQRFWVLERHFWRSD